MSNDRHQILNMLAEGKINVDEAEKLLNAIGNSDSNESQQGKSIVRGKPKYLRVVVNSAGTNGEKGEQVNVRIPMALMRAGIKLTSLLPDEAQDKVSHALKEKGVNFDFNDIKPESLEELIDALSELTVDVESSGEKVHVFCE